MSTRRNRQSSVFRVRTEAPKHEAPKASTAGPGSALGGIPTLTYQNLHLRRVTINSILGFIIRTYKKIGFGSLR